MLGAINLIGQSEIRREMKRLGPIYFIVDSVRQPDDAFACDLRGNDAFIMSEFKQPNGWHGLTVIGKKFQTALHFLLLVANIGQCYSTLSKIITQGRRRLHALMLYMHQAISPALQ